MNKIPQVEYQVSFLQFMVILHLFEQLFFFAVEPLGGRRFPKKKVEDWKSKADLKTASLEKIWRKVTWNSNGCFPFEWAVIFMLQSWWVEFLQAHVESRVTGNLRAASPPQWRDCYSKKPPKKSLKALFCWGWALRYCPLSVPCTCYLFSRLSFKTMTSHRALFSVSKGVNNWDLKRDSTTKTRKEIYLKQTVNYLKIDRAPKGKFIFQPSIFRCVCCYFQGEFF